MTTLEAHPIVACRCGRLLPKVFINRSWPKYEHFNSTAQKRTFSLFESVIASAVFYVCLLLQNKTLVRLKRLQAARVSNLLPSRNPVRQQSRVILKRERKRRALL